METVVLIEKDEVEKCRLLKTLLERGYKVCASSDPFDGIKWVKSNLMISICIIDLELEYSSERSIIDEVSNREKNIPVVLTAHLGAESTAEVRAALAMITGAVYILEKPYSDVEILKCIEKFKKGASRYRAR